MVKNEATFLCLQSKSSTKSTHRNCGTNRVSGKKSLTISEYSYKKYRTCIYIFLQYNEKKQIKNKKKNKEHISTIIKALYLYKRGLERNKKVLNGNVSICLEFKMSSYKVRCQMTRWYWRFNCNSGM